MWLFKFLQKLGWVAKPRIDYTASCRRLHEMGWPDCEPPPPIPLRKPQEEDEELGISFFRTLVKGDMSGLTLPRTYFGRSEISAATFRNTDLRESVLCWNDFADVDFAQADLRDSDLRASQFDRVSFVGANLSAADLRMSDFRRCRFDRASMVGATLTRVQGKTLSLSSTQIAEVNWVDDDGTEPGGG